MSSPTNGPLLHGVCTILGGGGGGLPSLFRRSAKATTRHYDGPNKWQERDGGERRARGTVSHPNYTMKNGAEGAEEDLAQSGGCGGVEGDWGGLGPPPPQPNCC